ncbi:helix-turn-helix transcriptional regulator [Bailinhaonella thermotolerans]|uniref:LuxR family transcriptional regulator n=1 Tax=Bailinhaonella thermotolerans TaxID=1070861 RepID=A0A3A4AWM0_9ACTN|nr:helix-turn-helix transcriptional regulator [Bailinhaonella thermotolerans]RJL30337.1 LuxR family transcriptional regulator [Bailinhaonella thermotolerans]
MKTVLDARMTLSGRHLRAFAEIGVHVAGLPGAAGGRAAMTALRQVVPLEAYEFVAYDPATGLHESLVSDGYPRVDEDAAEEFTRLESYRELMRRRTPVPMDPGTVYYRRHLEPYGWRAGLTAALFLPEGRYTGLLHLNARDPDAFGETTLMVISAVCPALAQVTDLTRCVVEPLGLPSGFSAVAFERSGRRRPVAGWPESEVIAAEPAMAELAREFIDSRELGRRGLWLAGDGEWREVRLLRAGVGLHGSIQGVIIAERRRGLPYGLTYRELEVLSRVARGDSNPQIAEALVLSVRTVTTHLERIFTKLGCDSRTRLTAKALAEGLQTLTLPPS